MREGAHTVLSSASRFYMPLIALFALTLLVTRPAGGGVGLVAGFAFLLALIAHGIVFGASAVRAAAPPWLMRLFAAAGLAAAAFGAAEPRFVLEREFVEGGLFVLTAAGGALIVTALFGRAPAMRDHAP